jgi:hypothetical protein
MEEGIGNFGGKNGMEDGRQFISRVQNGVSSSKEEGEEEYGHLATNTSPKVSIIHLSGHLHCKRDFGYPSGEMMDSEK